VTKDPELRRAVEYLRHRFGEDVAVVDHWDADLMAIGLARKGVAGKLAYLSVRSTSGDIRFFVALENPPKRDSDAPYEDAGSHGDLSLSQAADVIGRHLGWT
jgi:hypothetical protein